MLRWFWFLALASDQLQYLCRASRLPSTAAAPGVQHSKPKDKVSQVQLPPAAGARGGNITERTHVNERGGSGRGLRAPPSQTLLCSNCSCGMCNTTGKNKTNVCVHAVHIYESRRRRRCRRMFPCQSLPRRYLLARISSPCKLHVAYLCKEKKHKHIIAERKIKQQKNKNMLFDANTLVLEVK